MCHASGFLTPQCTHPTSQCWASAEIWPIVAPLDTASHTAKYDSTGSNDESIPLGFRMVTTGRSTTTPMNVTSPGWGSTSWFAVARISIPRFAADQVISGGIKGCSTSASEASGIGGTQLAELTLEVKGTLACGAK